MPDLYVIVFIELCTKVRVGRSAMSLSQLNAGGRDAGILVRSA